MGKLDENYKKAAQNIIDAMKQGHIPWRRDWKQSASQGAFGSLPYNYAAGNTYHGGNVMVLLATAAAKGYESNGWLSFNQARDLGGGVRKGEKCTHVNRVLNIKDEHGQPVLDETGRQKITILTFQVFNSEQCDGLPQRQARVEKPVDWQHERAEQLIAASGVDVRYGGNSAYYHVRDDYVQVPRREQFHSVEGLYATILHELGHASGHPSRLDRPMQGRFGSPDYAREELIAESFSLIVADRIGLSMDADYDPGNHVAYLQNWIKVLENDHALIFQAFKKAEEIATFYNVAEYTRAPLLEPKADDQRVKPADQPSRRGKSRARTRQPQRAQVA